MLSVNIQKRVGAFSLNVRFDAENEVLALLGASGCGKSMTLKCIAGIERPDSGRIVLDDTVLFDSERKIDLRPRQRCLGYLFQQCALFPNMTVGQNIGVVVGRGSERKKAIAELCRALRLEGLEDQYPHQLSGGQQQRAALARILAAKPKLLLLDEPFSALDSYLKWQLELELAEVLREFPGTAVFVSHSRDEVYRLADRVCVLADGRSERVKPVREFFAQPDTVAAALISGCKNFSRIRRLDEYHLEALDWGCCLTTAARIPDDCTVIGVRAHYIRPEGAGASNRVSAAVTHVTESPFSTILMLDTGTGTGERSRIRLELDREAAVPLLKSAALVVTIPPEAIMLLNE